MILKVFLTLYITSTSCQKHEDFQGKEYKKVDKGIFDLKIIDDKENIIFTIKSKDYVPVDAKWYSGDKKFEIKTLSIDGYKTNDWMKKNVTNVNLLDNFLKNLDQHAFRIEISKQKFAGKYNDLECVLIVIEKNNFQKLITDLSIKRQSISPNDFISLKQLEEEFFITFERLFIFFGIKFAENSGKMPNFNDYEVGVYILKSKNYSFSANASFKKTPINSLVGIFLIVVIVGALIFAVRYFLSKCF